MQNVQEFLIAAVAFIVLVGLMVVVHEFGHFIVAKLFKIRVEAFSFGFGPRLFGIKYGETDYKVCLLPLGGFVKMTGENPGETEHANDPAAFTSHPRWQRMLVGLAGPVANFILAFVLMLFYYGFINEEPRHELQTTTVEWVIDGSPAATAGLAPGDVIRKFDNVNNPSWDQVNQRVSINLNQTVGMVVDRGGKEVPLSMHVPDAPKGQDFEFGELGLIPQFIQGPIGVQHVEPGTPAAQAGLRDGDAIVTVDGHGFHTVIALLSYLQAGQGKPVSLEVTRNGATQPPIIAHPAKVDGDEWKLGFQPTPVPYGSDPLSFGKAVVKSKNFCLQNSTLIVEVLGRLFTRQVSVSQLSGPVGIARMAGTAAQTKDWLSKFTLAAAISLNLGILNLVPFPILDGGMIMLLLVESIIRQDISTMVKERIYQAAFVLIMVFFAFIIFNDVTKLPIFTHIKP
jgi:regulator of sigma E protease